MPPRPATKGRDSRPVSAIYLGSGSKQASSSASGIIQQTQASSSSPHPVNGPASHLPDLPDLPEPPSPGSSVGSRNSGLPSPPATNSTGSGSTGDPGSVARRQRPLSLASDSSASASSSSHRTMSDTFRRNPVPSSRSSSRLADIDTNDFDDDDDDPDNDRDGDDTARLDRRHHAQSSVENVRALQRVMSLKERNRMALDKLTRLGSPSPSPRSRSPAPSHASATSSSRLRQVQPASRDRSGSETERESTSVHTYSSHSHSSSHTSSSQRPITPPSNASHSNTTSPYGRLRNLSAPDSPNRARLLNAASGGSNSSNSPSRRRKRASMATMTSITQNYEDEDNYGENQFGTATGPGRDRLRNDRDTVRDITQSALAAVASSRRSPLGVRRRSALPREFREDPAGNAHADSASIVSDARSRRSEEVHRPSRLSIEPMTPHRNGGVGRSSTVRETRRSGDPPRWASQDYRAVATPDSPTSAVRERRQSLRGGSAESALGMRSPGGRTLLGEGLRAAGLTKRDDPKRSPSAANSGDVFHNKQLEWSPSDDKGKRRAVTYSRAATSMANYRYTDGREDEIERERGFRNHRSSYSLAQDSTFSPSKRPRDISLTRTEREQLELDHNNSELKAPRPRSVAISLLPVAKIMPQHLQERNQAASPFGIKRQSAATPGPGSGEHSRLMLESLSAFESIVSKLPPSSGISSLGSIPSNNELLKHAHTLVATADRMNALMRQGTGRALEEQINVEVEGDNSTSGKGMLEVWRQVGGEYRDGLRASDELVRSITSFLMDTGSVMRKLASTPAMSDFGSPAVHARAMSLDEEGIRQQQQSIADSAEASNGRRSVESRRSWEPVSREREREREETLRKLGGTGGGRESSLGLARASPALLAVRDRDKAVFQTPSPLSGTRPLPPAGSSVRRLFVPREQARPDEEEAQISRDASGSTMAMRPSDSQQTVQANLVEPSPTPGSRTIGRDRSRTLPPIQPEPARRAPPTSSTMTSLDRISSVRDRNAGHERRKPSVASIATIRGSGPAFTSLTTPSSATTGISTHTVSSSPEESNWLPRSNSDKSARSVVTFSHPNSTPVSVALSGIQRQAIDDDRRRTNDHPQQQAQSSLNTFKTPAKLSAPGMIKARSEDPKRQTVGTSRAARMSLDNLRLSDGDESPSLNKNANVHPADRSAVMTALPSGRKERRRTVTDIWPQD